MMVGRQATKAATPLAYSSARVRTSQSHCDTAQYDAIDLDLTRRLCRTSALQKVGRASLLQNHHLNQLSSLLVPRETTPKKCRPGHRHFYRQRGRRDPTFPPGKSFSLTSRRHYQFQRLDAQTSRGETSQRQGRFGPYLPRNAP